MFLGFCKFIQKYNVELGKALKTKVLKYYTFQEALFYKPYNFYKQVSNN